MCFELQSSDEEEEVSPFEATYGVAAVGAEVAEEQQFLVVLARGVVLLAGDGLGGSVDVIDVVARLARSGDVSLHASSRWGYFRRVVSKWVVVLFRFVNAKCL